MRRIFSGDSPKTDPTRTYRFQRQILPYNARLYPFFENPQILIVRCIPNFLLARFMPFLPSDLKVCETVTFVLTLVLYANAIYSVLYIIEGKLNWTGKHYILSSDILGRTNSTNYTKFQNLLLQRSDAFCCMWQNEAY